VGTGNEKRQAVKYCCFDLDGVLCDMDRPHFDALNAALATCGPQAVITETEHFAIFKGLPTRVKLEMLVQAGRVPERMKREVARLKQEKTIEAIRNLQSDSRKVDLLRRLARDRWQLCVCSNAVRNSVREMLLAGRLIGFLAFFLSNEDAPPKPAPGMYLKAASIFGVSPDRLVVVEDSAPGRASALAAGCKLVAVEGPEEVGPELIPRLEAAAKEAEWAGTYASSSSVGSAAG